MLRVERQKMHGSERLERGKQPDRKTSEKTDTQMFANRQTLEKTDKSRHELQTVIQSREDKVQNRQTGELVAGCLKGQGPEMK